MKKKTSTDSWFWKAMNIFGTRKAIADALSINPSQISRAQKKGVLGFKHAYRLYKVTNGEITVEECMNLEPNALKNIPAPKER